MSRLASLLGNNHPLFAYNVNQLEKATGGAGVDTRLISDCSEKAHSIMRELGLDPRDSLALEVNNVLEATVGHGSADELFADTDYVLAIIDGEPISFNLEDITENISRVAEGQARTCDHARRHLRAEVIRRYAEHDRTHNELVHALAAEAGLSPDHDQNKSQPTESREKSNMNDHKPYILAIGDIFTDAFITLGEDTAKIFTEGDTEWLAVPFGRKPPYEKAEIVKSVGPSPNVAVSMARLGFRAGLMAWVGGDQTGQEALEHLRAENVSTDDMIVEEDKATSYWYVLCYKADRTMLVKSEKYRYEWQDPTVKPDWVYLAYLGADSWPLHEGLLDYLDRNPDIKFALQPGTFQFKWGLEKMAPLYQRSDIVLMNREEAMDVTGLPYDSITNLANGLHEIGPSVVVITDGPNGSYASEDGKVYTIPNYPDPVPPLERTGAGDAFSSTFVAAIASGESIQTALAWSPINSMNVVQHVGAQKGLLTLPEIQEYLAKAPDFYTVTEFSD